MLEYPTSAATEEDEYIAKPFDIDMLNLCILNLLKKRKNVSTEYVITEADRKFIDEVNVYIRDNMSNPETSVESLSTHLSISRVQLYKRMISLTGITPSEYLRTKRIKFAEHKTHCIPSGRRSRSQEIRSFP